MCTYTVLCQVAAGSKLFKIEIVTFFVCLFVFLIDEWLPLCLQAWLLLVLLLVKAGAL